MPAVARANQIDQVQSLTGNGAGCAFPLTTTTGTGTTNVFVNGHPIVIEGEAVQPHPRVGCVLVDQSTLSIFSAKVFVQGKGSARLGDQYTSDNTITTGSPNVFFG